jgi:hypothetical protein
MDILGLVCHVCRAGKFVMLSETWQDRVICTNCQRVFDRFH